jgi:hypothetical protein
MSIILSLAAWCSESGTRWGLLKTARISGSQGARISGKVSVRISGTRTGHGVVLAIRRPDILLHGFLGLSLVDGEIVKGFDVGRVLVRAGHGSLLERLKWSTTEERTFRRVSAASEQRTQELDEIPVALLESEARRSSEI